MYVLSPQQSATELASGCGRAIGFIWDGVGVRSFLKVAQPSILGQATPFLPGQGTPTSLVLGWNLPSLCLFLLLALLQGGRATGQEKEGGDAAGAEKKTAFEWQSSVCVWKENAVWRGQQAGNMCPTQANSITQRKEKDTG